MGNTNKASKKRAGTVRCIKLLDLRGREIKVYQAFLNLESDGRAALKELLLRHASLPEGRNSYVYWGRWNELDRRSAYLSLLADASVGMANAWHEWAFEISEKQMSAPAWRDTILTMLGQLVRAESIEEGCPKA